MKELPPIATTPILDQLQTADGQPFNIPADGAIGLLALGDIGIIAWRQKRQQLKAEGIERQKQISNT